MRLLPFELLTLALPAALAASGSFNVLQYNVAGLPSILNDNGISGGKANAATLVGQKFAQFGFDIIHVQEDFHYHQQLYDSDFHPYRTNTSGDVPFGSGLNTLSNFDWTDFKRVKWNRCGLNSGDCFAPKGFTYMRMRITDGVTVDVYNLHADAGDESGDYAARRTNIQQVADHIDAYSAGQAVLVFGDTNTLYSRPDNIRMLGMHSGLRDAWLEQVHNGSPPADVTGECPVPAPDNRCETLDKVLYRSGEKVELKVASFEYASDMFLQSDGGRLSDHNPLLVDFEWSTVPEKSQR